MGLSSSGPSQTLAVSLAGLVAASGYGGIVPILICFIPMMGIAIAYQRLNRWDQSSGATYSWVAKVFHPYLGFVSGWMILLYYTLGTTSLTVPAGIYTLDLIAPAHVDDHAAIFWVGAAWNLLITTLAVLGLKMVARFEWTIVIFEYVVLLIVAAVAIFNLLSGTGTTPFSWDWFSWTSLGGMKGMMGGILIACFMYSGWDAAIYVNEETSDRANNPGRAALASVVMLALVYSVTTFAFQSVLTPGELQAHAGNALSAVSGRLLHRPWDSVMALVVLTGTLASLQAAVVSAARVGLAMSRDRVMPRYFQRVRAGSRNPWAATLTMSAINLLLLALVLGNEQHRLRAQQRCQQSRSHFDRFLRHHRGRGLLAPTRYIDLDPGQPPAGRTDAVDRSLLQSVGADRVGGDRRRHRHHHVVRLRLDCPGRSDGALPAPRPARRIL